MYTYKRTIRFNALLFAGFFLVMTCWILPNEAYSRQSRGGTRTSVKRGGGAHRGGNRNVNRNVNKNVNVNVNNRHHGGGHRPPPPPRHRHNVGGVIAAGVVTGLVVGSIVAAASMPPSCTTVVINGISYRQCGSSWYQPQYAGTQVNYIVVNPPR